MKPKKTDQTKRLAVEPAVMVGPAVTRHELILIGAVLAAGIGLRAVSLSRSAVEHFDEGVYASNIYFGGPDYAYPLLRFYAPPLLPALIESGMILGLPPNVAALLPSFLAGCGTIVALWWFGRSWFGPEVGLASATLAALSPFHIIYSAAALTDVLLGLWIVLAIDAAGRSLLATDYRWAIGSGIYTGLAWWTKYNGWLPLAIEAAAIPLLWLWLRPPQREWLGWLYCFAVTVVVTAVAWSPFCLALQRHGGYAPIAANHAKYVVGLAGWLNSASRQIANQFVLEGLLAALAPLAAFSLPLWLFRQRPRVVLTAYLKSVGLGFLAIVTTSLLLAAAGAILGCVRMWIVLQKAEIRDAAWKRRAIGTALLAAWIGGLLVATPLYSPYPRLVMPLFAAAWLGFAINAGEFRIPGRDSLLGFIAWRRQALVCLCFIALSAVPWLLGSFVQIHALRNDRRDVLRIAEEIAKGETNQKPRAIYVHGEPALYFQLRAAGEEIVAPVQEIPGQAATIDEKAVPTFLIFGPHAERDPEFQRQWPAEKNSWQLVEEFECAPSALVWLDLNDPRRPVDGNRYGSFRLYRFQSAK